MPADILFLSKSLDDLDGYLTSIRDYKVYACRASKPVYKKYPRAIVHEITSGERLFSTNYYFRRILPALNVGSHINENISVWVYQAAPWCDDLKILGVTVYAIPYLLFCALHNKYRQIDLLLHSAASVGGQVNSIISNAINTRVKNMHTIYTTYNVNQYGELKKNYPDEFVVANSASDGGSNVFLVDDEKDYLGISGNLSSLVVRIESAILPSTPINQIGIVLGDGEVIKYQPSIQIIVKSKEYNRLEYQGSNYQLSQFDIQDIDGKIEEITSLTNAVGKSLFAIGYRGIFGCDYIISESAVYFVELNPRYQASTRILSMATEDRPELSPHYFHINSFSKSNEFPSPDKNSLSPQGCIEVLKPGMPYGFIRIWDRDSRCDRPMSGKILENSKIHVGYNLLL